MWHVVLEWETVRLSYDIGEKLPALALAQALNRAESDVASVRDVAPDDIRMDRPIRAWGEA